MKPYRVVVVPVGKEPEVTLLEPGLKPLQELVGGYVEMVKVELLVEEPVVPGVKLVCNEEGRLTNLPLNRRIGRLPVFGDVLLAKTTPSGAAFCSLTEEEADALVRWLKEGKAA